MSTSIIIIINKIICVLKITFIFFLIILLISFLFIFHNARSKDEDYFYPEKKNLIFFSLPDDFAYVDDRDIESWYEDMEWRRVSSDAELELSLYTNKNDNSGILWISFEDQIAQTDWDASIREARFYRQDIDNDGEEEIIIIMTAGTAHWVREYIHIIDKSYDGEYMDVSFPIDNYWKWVRKHIKSNGDSSLSFFDVSAQLSAEHSLPSNAEISKDLYIFYGDIEDGKIIASVEIDADWDEIPSPCVMGMVETDFIFDGKKFSVSEYRIKDSIEN